MPKLLKKSESYSSVTLHISHLAHVICRACVMCWDGQSALQEGSPVAKTGPQRSGGSSSWSGPWRIGRLEPRRVRREWEGVGERVAVSTITEEGRKCHRRFPGVWLEHWGWTWGLGPSCDGLECPANELGLYGPGVINCLRGQVGNLKELLAAWESLSDSWHLKPLGKTVRTPQRPGSFGALHRCHW